MSERFDCLIGRTDDPELAGTIREGFIRFDDPFAAEELVFTVLEYERERQPGEAYDPEGIGFTMTRDDALALAEAIERHYAPDSFRSRPLRQGDFETARDGS